MPTLFSWTLAAADLTFGALFDLPAMKELATLLSVVHVSAPGCERDAPAWEKPYDRNFLTVASVQ